MWSMPCWPSRPTWPGERVGVLALTFALGYALANTFSAWALLRRSPAAAGLHFVAAAGLTVGGVAAAYGVREAVPLVAGGALLAVAAALRIAWVGLRRPPPWRLFARIGAGALAVLFAQLAARL